MLRSAGRLFPASSLLFVDSSLMTIGIVLNSITEHKVVLQMKTCCAHINYTFFPITILHQFLTREYNIVEIMSH